MWIRVHPTDDDDDKKLILLFCRSSLLVDLIKLCVECGKVSLAEDYAESAKGGAKVSRYVMLHACHTWN